jgi:hypothetical protein
MPRTRAILLLACLACRTTTTSTPANTTNVTASHTAPVEAWELWDADARLGSIVRYEGTGPGRKGFFGVRDVDGQDLGMIDLQGRAWRYRPHRREPEWLGTGTILKGARLVLGGGAASHLVEIELETLDGAGYRPPAR